MVAVAVNPNGHYQIMPDLSPDEYEALKADIRECGILVPIELDENGCILDGHHRLRAWHELKAEGAPLSDYPRLIRSQLTEEQKRNHVRALNLLRRHLTKDQLREQMIEMRRDGATLQEIAEATGSNPETVRQATDDSTSNNLKVQGKDGKARPAKYKRRKTKTVLATSKAEETKALDAVAKAGDNLPDKIVSTNRAARIAREAEAEARMPDSTELAIGSAQLWLGDFRERGAAIADGSVDLIFTDPPYPCEFLPLWSDLSAFASRVLKPNGMLVAYTGAMDLPEVIQRLGEHLRYWWMGAVVLDGPHSRVFARNIAQGCKPLLFYVRPDYAGETWLEDTYRSEGEQKESHEWQQSVGAALHYIERLTPTDGLVVDPFLGGGTTGLAALQLGRQFVGIEIDGAAFATASERLSQRG